jgi:hypothetical protein
MMDKINKHMSINKINLKQSKDNINSKTNKNYFTIQTIPYNKILSNLLLFLKKRLSPFLFNEIYRYYINEIKKYMNISSKKNQLMKEKNMSQTANNKSGNAFVGRNKPLMNEFSLNNYMGSQKNKNMNTKKMIKKTINPLIDLSYSNKYETLNSKKSINSSSFSNLNFNNLDINFIKGFSNKYKSNFIGNKTFISNSNSNSIEKELTSINNNKSKKRKKIMLNTNNKFILNEKLINNKISVNNNYHTINTSIHKVKNSNKFKKIDISKKKSKDNKSQYLSNNIKKKISNNRTLTIIPNQAFVDAINKNRNNNKLNTTANSITKNAVVINNTIFNKYKNNYNIGLIKNNKKKLKIINIKLPNLKNNGGDSTNKPMQTSEEMLNKIKNSLDDDNLKGMLNFSYENFLSKESERESKDYSIEDNI